MQTIIINTIRGPVSMSAAAAEYVGHRLGEGAIHWCRGAFGALGLDNEVSRWAFRAERVIELSEALLSARYPEDTERSLAEVVAPDNAAAAAIRVDLDNESAAAAEAWAPLQSIIDQCRAAVEAEVSSR